MMSVAACGGEPPETLGLTEDGTLPPCPETPNCVHTGMRHPQGTEPIYLTDAVELGELMRRLRSVVDAMPRMTIITVDARYLHAEERSRVFRFVDDMEMVVTADRELVVRSASRVGRSDLGVNGRRLERLRRRLAEAGLLR
jgi:uncharacterized protein (DUF1499 family)